MQHAYKIILKLTILLHVALQIEAKSLVREAEPPYPLISSHSPLEYVLDDEGNTLSQIQYQPYGETFVQRGDLNFSPKYNSQELDRESGFYFYNARYYDPGIARFTSADTIIDGEFDTQGWNRFSYVKGNPIGAKDPSGHFEIHAHDEGTGHIGASVNGKSYDFGRYKGEYTDSLYSGPNILKEGNKTSQQKYMNNKGGSIYKVEVSKELDKAIEKSFAKQMKEYDKAFPKDIKERMPSGNRNLSSNERYTKSDWGVSGPNCVTNTEKTLRDSMNNVISTSKNKKLVEEAKNTNSTLDKIFSLTVTPGGVKSNLDKLSEKNEVRKVVDFSKNK
ncbi:RHS repeat-associated core domain-containing protein [Leptospira santarosai]|uniref:RHS repeat-associated core domain-containing protein n=1 Tax=Leptospira santarosai TaxID=28183 RepID=UPI00077327C9|nr:RHS repeat-associated core domain-containing protein [Leptospira santarosai]